MAGFLIQHTLHQTGNGIDHAECRQLTAGQHIIADGDIFRTQQLQRAFIHALIVAAEEDQVLLLRKLLRKALIKAASLGGHIQHPGTSSQLLCNSSIAVINGLHLHQHPGPAAVRRIVHMSVPLLGEAANVHCLHMDFAVLNGTAGNGGIHGIHDHIREQGHDIVVFHRSSRPSRRCTLI